MNRMGNFFCSLQLFLWPIVFLCGCATPDRLTAISCAPELAVSSEIFELRVISIGEIHGVKEVPATVGILACNIARSGKSVVVGLEISSRSQSSIDAFLTSGGSPKDRDTLLSDAHWRARYQDGRSSVAMFDLIDQLRQLRSIGAHVQVLAFDIANISTDKPRDQVMADNVAASVARHPNDVHLLLSGNFHASKQATFRHDPAFKSMAWRLNRIVPVATFNAEFAEGTAWSCRGSEPSDCGPRPASTGWRGDTKPAIRFDETMKRPGAFLEYDGVLVVGAKVTASPPAVPQ